MTNYVRRFLINPSVHFVRLLIHGMITVKLVFGLLCSLFSPGWSWGQIWADRWKLDRWRNLLGSWSFAHQNSGTFSVEGWRRFLPVQPESNPTVFFRRRDSMSCSSWPLRGSTRAWTCWSKTSTEDRTGLWAWPEIWLRAVLESLPLLIKVMPTQPLTFRFCT